MQKFLTTVSAAALGLALLGAATLPVSAQSLAGSYLAGRSATLSNDFGAAAEYYASALARDPSNVELMDNATLAYIALGRVDRAEPLARAIVATGQQSQAARMAITAGLAGAGDFDALAGQDVRADGINPWVDGLVKAWALIGSDDVDGAIEQFDSISTEGGMGGIVLFHKALALATVGRYEEAETVFATDGPGAAARTRRGVMARTEILSQLGRNDEAVQVIDTTFNGSTDPELDAVIARLNAGEKLPFTHAPTARAGMAEVYYTFAALLRAERASDYFALLYARVAVHLRPDHVDALLLTAGLLEDLGQYNLAIEQYRAVDVSDPAYHVAELGRAAALRRLDKADQAIEVLEQLGRSHGGWPLCIPPWAIPCVPKTKTSLQSRHIRVLWISRRRAIIAIGFYISHVASPIRATVTPSPPRPTSARRLRSTPINPKCSITSDTRWWKKTASWMKRWK